MLMRRLGTLRPDRPDRLRLDRSSGQSSNYDHPSNVHDSPPVGES